MLFPPIYRVEEPAEDPAVAKIRETHNKKEANGEGSKIRNKCHRFFCQERLVQGRLCPQCFHLIVFVL